MIHVLAYITAKPGQRDQLLKEFRALVPLVRAEKGCIEYGPAVDAEMGGIQTRIGVDGYVVVEKWESLEALKAHIAAPHMAAYGAKVKDMISSRVIYVLTPDLIRLPPVEPIETASRDELAALQLGRLRGTLAHAYERVPHYRRALAASGFRPGDLTSLDDLALLPFTTKEDLRQNYPFGMFAVAMDEIVRIHASSGTTGRPTVVGYSRADIDMWAGVMARSIRAAGGRPTDKLHNAYGYGLFTGGLGFHYGAEALGCAVIPVAGGFTERQARLIADFRPDIIAATPSYLLAIADEVERQGMSARDCSLRIAICGAEPWSEGMRAEIERRLGLVAVDCYGLSEVIGPGVGQECAETKDGPTIWEDHFLPEIVDPETGRVLPEGEEGELVFTSLTKEAMPVIRFRTHDLSRLLPGTARPMRRIARIKGRSDDMLIIRGVNVFPSQIEAVLTAEALLAPHYLLEVTRPGRLDELEVVVESRDRLPLEADGPLECHAEHLLKSLIGLTTRVRVVAPGAIERSEGKARRVIDKRHKS